MHGAFFWLMEQGFAGCFKVVFRFINRVGVSLCSYLLVFFFFLWWGGGLALLPHVFFLGLLLQLVVLLLCSYNIITI